MLVLGAQKQLTASQFAVLLCLLRDRPHMAAGNETVLSHLKTATQKPGVLGIEAKGGKEIKFIDLL